MRTLLVGLSLCLTFLAEPKPEVEVVVPPSAAHPQSWLSPLIRDNPKPDYRGKSTGSLAEFVAPEVVSKIVVDQYAGPPDDVRRYLTAMPTGAAQYFGPSLDLCKFPDPKSSQLYGAALQWTSTSTVTFESGRRGSLAVATVVVSRIKGPPLRPLAQPKVYGLSDRPDCAGLDKVPVDSLYVSYVDPDGYSWSFAVPLQRPGSGAVSGRILSADGKPASNITVVVSRVSDCCIPFNPHATTDTDGKYQLLDILPGDYHVAVLTPGLPLTFYPGAGTQKDATSVTVKRGETISNIDFRIAAEGQIIPPAPPKPPARF